MLAQQVTDITNAHGLREITQDFQYTKDSEKITEILKLAAKAACNGAWSIEYAVRLIDYPEYARILTSRGFSFDHENSTSYSRLRDTLGYDGVAIYKISWNRGL